MSLLRAYVQFHGNLSEQLHSACLNMFLPLSLILMSHPGQVSGINTKFTEKNDFWKSKMTFSIQHIRVLKILSAHFSFSPPIARIIISRIRPALYLLGVLLEDRRKGHTALWQTKWGPEGHSCKGVNMKQVCEQTLWPFKRPLFTPEGGSLCHSEC